MAECSLNCTGALNVRQLVQQRLPYPRVVVKFHLFWLHALPCLSTEAFQLGLYAKSSLAQAEELFLAGISAAGRSWDFVSPKTQAFG